jgi:hypothetical protein
LFCFCFFSFFFGVLSPQEATLLASAPKKGKKNPLKAICKFDVTILDTIFNFSADEEAGEVGPNEDDEDTNNGVDNNQGGVGEVKVETNQRQSLTRRLSNLYGSLLSKAAPKKSDRSAASSGASIGIGNAAADVDAKVNVIIYPSCL